MSSINFFTPVCLPIGHNRPIVQAAEDFFFFGGFKACVLQKHSKEVSLQLTTTTWHAIAIKILLCCTVVAALAMLAIKISFRLSNKFTVKILPSASLPIMSSPPPTTATAYPSLSLSSTPPPKASPIPIAAPAHAPPNLSLAAAVDSSSPSKLVRIANKIALMTKAHQLFLADPVMTERLKTSMEGLGIVARRKIEAAIEAYNFFKIKLERLHKGIDEPLPIWKHATKKNETALKMLSPSVVSESDATILPPHIKASPADCGWGAYLSNNVQNMYGGCILALDNDALEDTDAIFYESGQVDYIHKSVYVCVIENILLTSTSLSCVVLEGEDFEFSRLSTLTDRIQELGVPILTRRALNEIHKYMEKAFDASTQLVFPSKWGVDKLNQPMPIHMSDMAKRPLAVKVKELHEKQAKARAEVELEPAAF